MLDRMPVVRALIASAVPAFVGGALFFWDDVLPAWRTGANPFEHRADIFECLVMIVGLGTLGWALDRRGRAREVMLAVQVEHERQAHLLTLGRLAGAVAHEVRNPAHNLLLLCEALQQAECPPQSKALIDRCVHNVRRIDDAVRLVYGLAAPCQVEDQRSTSACDHIVQEAWQEVCQELPAVPTLHRQGQPALAWRMSPAHARLVVHNLLRNAAQACLRQQQSAIRVTTQAQGGVVTMSIENSGTLSDERQRDGLGLGLHIARALVEQSGGTFSLEMTAGTVRALLAMPQVAA